MSVLNTASSDYERFALVKFEEIMLTYLQIQRKFEFYLYSLISKKFHRLKNVVESNVHSNLKLEEIAFM
jgi:hypothetical protein